MICIIALVVFSIMAIFSARYRPLAREAFNCVFRRITLRKCESGLNVRLRAQITGTLMQKSEKLAAFVFRYFEALSWIFIILTIASFGYAAYGGYNYYLYGNCNGPKSAGFCIFDPLGSHSKMSELPQGTCPPEAPEPRKLTIGVDLSQFPQWNVHGKNTVVFIGCYLCPYTRQAYPAIKNLAENQNVHFIFAHLPIKNETEYLSNIVYCISQQDTLKVNEFNSIVFSADASLVQDEKSVYDMITQIGLNAESIKSCATSNQTMNAVGKWNNEIIKTNVYGTPTVFVNGEPVVGPKPYRVYKRLLN